MPSKKRPALLLLCLLLLGLLLWYRQSRPEPTLLEVEHQYIADAERIQYTQANRPLYIFRLPPKSSQTSSVSFVLFHGGGWIYPTISQILPVARALQEMGHEVLLPEYRVLSVDKSTPAEAVEDARRALDFISKLNKDPARSYIIGGVSVGAQLAAMMLSDAFLAQHAMKEKIKGAVMLSPVLDISPGGYGHDMVAHLDWQRISPMHQTFGAQGRVPVFLAHARDDREVAFETTALFSKRTDIISTRHAYDTGGHLIFIRHQPSIDDVAQKIKVWMDAMGA